MPPRSLRYAGAATLLLTLVACGGNGGSDGGPTSTPTPTATETPTTSPSAEPTSAEPSSAEPTDAAPSGGTADAPAALTPQTDLLDWQQVGGPIGNAVTRNEDWSLTVKGNGATWELAGPGSSTGGGSAGWQVSDALLDDDWAVVVLQDKTEQLPSRAQITDLGTGKSFRLDGRSDVPTTNGGTWALGDDRLLHASIRGGAYCLASVDLESRRSTVGWCAPKRHGFSGAHVTDDADSLLTFDDSQPSCRSVVSLDGATATPFPGVTACKAWDGVAFGDGAVWSVIPKERRIEEARLYARVGDGYFDLGPGTAGSLVWCDDAAYFTRDPQRRSEPAALMRWSADDGLTVVYHSPKGEAFVEAPRCGGDTMTLTARTSSGDEQVTADLG